MYMVYATKCSYRCFPPVLFSSLSIYFICLLCLNLDCQLCRSETFVCTVSTMRWSCSDGSCCNTNIIQFAANLLMLLISLTKPFCRYFPNSTLVSIWIGALETQARSYSVPSPFPPTFLRWLMLWSHLSLWLSLSSLWSWTKGSCSFLKPALFMIISTAVACWGTQQWYKCLLWTQSFLVDLPKFNNCFGENNAESYVFSLFNMKNLN